MDLLTVTGLLLGWMAILVGAKLEGLRFDSLLKLSAFCIVGVGTFAAACTGFTMEQLKGFPDALRRCFSPGKQKAVDIIPVITGYARKARHSGLLILEPELKIQKDPFFKKSLQLLIDGNSIDDVRTIMESELVIWEEQEKIYEKFLRAMGGFSPTLGIIGTVMGLIHVMGNLGEPDKIAAGIATAFIATFYGVSFANLIFLPLAAKLKARREEAILIKEMILAGVLSIGSGDSSLIVMEKLCTYLNEEDRARIMAKKNY
ncbi:MAG: MotA/TolQ/ExbB proton channel family protein [Candidatus Eremiobacterota bacterium]